MPDPTLPEGERLTAVDAARGLAIIGVGLCNATGFATRLSDAEALPHLVSAGERGLWVAEQVLLQGRLVALLSLLFGASMLWVGGDGTDTVRNGRLNRRLIWLAVIGLLHGVLLWWGDILLPYAIAGLMVRGLRGWPPQRQLVIGIAAYAAGVSLLRIDGAVALIGLQSATAMVAPFEAHLPDGLGAGSFLPAFATLIGQNAKDWVAAVPQTSLATLLTSAPLMLIGMGLVRLGWLAPAELTSKAGQFVLGGSAAALIALPIALMQAGLWPAPAGWSLQALSFWAVTLRLVTAPAGAMAWLAVAALLPRLQPVFAPLGCLALSAYIGQSLLARLGFALTPQAFGHIDYAVLMTTTAAVLVAQWGLAMLWARQGWRGPDEALWRRLYLQSV